MSPDCERACTDCESTDLGLSYIEYCAGAMVITVLGQGYASYNTGLGLRCLQYWAGTAVFTVLAGAVAYCSVIKSCVLFGKLKLGYCLAR